MAEASTTSSRETKNLVAYDLTTVALDAPYLEEVVVVDKIQ